MIQFGNDNAGLDIIINGHNKTSFECATDNTARIINIASKFRHRGAKVSERVGGSGGLIVDFGRTFSAKKTNISFVKSILDYCTSGKCGLINQPEEPIWDIQQLGINKYLITQKF